MKQLFLLAAILAAGWCACSRESSAHSTDPAVVIPQLGLRLPTGTRVLGASASNDGDGLVRAKLEMPAIEVAGFIENANIQSLEEAHPDLLGPDEGFWDPHRAGPLRSGNTMLPGARGLFIAVDESRPNAAVVYVMLHGT